MPQTLANVPCHMDGSVPGLVCFFFVVGSESFFDIFPVFVKDRQASEKVILGLCCVLATQILLKLMLVDSWLPKLLATINFSSVTPPRHHRRGIVSLPGHVAHPQIPKHTKLISMDRDVIVMPASKDSHEMLFIMV